MKPHMFKVNTIEGAIDCLETLLKNKPNRLNHSKQVYRNTKRLVSKNRFLFPNEELREQCIIASILHDIGYADGINKHKAHTVDGYIYLKESGWNENICKSVLNHTYAKELLTLYNHNHLLSYYNIPISEDEQILIDIITLADMHSSPTGNFFSVQERIDDIKKRYGEDSPSYTHIKEAEKDINRLLKTYNI